MLGYVIAITVLVVGWGYLVWTAIDFGSDARGGDSDAWTFAGLSALGAAACLFAGLMLAARLARALGMASMPAPRQAHATPLNGTQLGTIETSTVIGPGGPPTRNHLAEPRNPYAPPLPHQQQPPAPAPDHSRPNGSSHRHRAG